MLDDRNKGMKTDGKRVEKDLSGFRFYFFSGNRIEFGEKNEIKNGWGYTEIRKQTKMDEELEN
jgi:hypothetical protein